MTRCAVRRGFFTLRDCGDLAANTCMVCMRPVCAGHFTMRDGSVLCVECNAREDEENSDEEDGEEEYDESWAYSQRHDYYSNSRYNPFYAGYRQDHYYDDYDVRGLDKKEGEILEGDEESGAGFLDS